MPSKADRLTHEYFKGYLDPMDRADQSLILNTFEDANLRRGMCLMLSINWVLQAVDGSGPDVAWQTLKQGGPSLLKQIAQQQAGYTNDDVVNALTEDGSKGPCKALFEAASKGTHSVLTYIGATNPTEFAVAVDQGLAQSTTTPPAILIVFYYKDNDTKEKWGHAIAASINNSITYIFDPNYGVFKVNPKTGGSIDDIIEKLFAFYTKYYKATLQKGFICIVK